ncbi:hypothetical protein RSAG8_13765, partial [Rhizoctonia solani AG-8 WAC10335]
MIQFEVGDGLALNRIFLFLKRRFHFYLKPAIIDQILDLLLFSLRYDRLIFVSLEVLNTWVQPELHTTPCENIKDRGSTSLIYIQWCCFGFWPTKSSFIHMVKWLVLQFLIVRPIASIISIILYALGLLCPTDLKTTEPNLWLTIVDIFSMVTAMYGLIIAYILTKQDIREHRPLLKFGIIKGIVFLTIFQELVFKFLLKSGRIKPSESWSSVEVVDGLNAVLLTIEMAAASVAMLWTFSASEYSDPERLRGTPAPSNDRQLEFW